MTASPDHSNRCWPAVAGLCAVVVLVYLPTILHGGFIWDDPQHITANHTLRDLPGLLNLWIHPTSIPQYYPLVHTTFWIEYHLWGVHPAGYHIDNILLHALTAVLLWRALARLNVPGALIAAALFALHPIQVESVAWATERKNVLSAVFYLLSFHAYLNWAGEDFSRPDRRQVKYLLAMLLFVAALLSKSVTCSLPAAILLVIYWHNGRVRWRDVAPLIPFFIAGLAMALVTGTIERQHVGASGNEWNWSFGQRCLIASRALCFYVGKIFWPHPLIFIYPQWHELSITQHPWLILFPAAVFAGILILWLGRSRLGRGPLVAGLFFAGTLLPALGFVNVFPMRYSFVADHFQYLASIGIFVLIGAMLSHWHSTHAISLVVLITLSILTIRQQAMYRDALTLWRTTSEQNPSSWMVWGDLGDEYAERSNRDDESPAQRAQDHALATDAYARMLALAPDRGVSHWKWGITRESAGDPDGARREFEVALQLEPNAAPVLDSMGSVLIQLHKPQEAGDYFTRATHADPGYSLAHFHLGVALESAGDIDGAIHEYFAAFQANPDSPDAAYNLANLLSLTKSRPDLSLGYYAAAVDQRPRRADYRVNFANALRQVGEFAAARQQCEIALQLDPNLQPARALWQSLQSP